MSRRKRKENSLAEAWDEVKSGMHQSYGYGLVTTTGNSSSSSLTTTNIYTTSGGTYHTTSGGTYPWPYSSDGNIITIQRIDSPPPPVRVKPKTQAEWLRLRVEEMCKEGRLALEAA